MTAIQFKPTRHPPVCIKCDYTLTGLVDARCPECGLAFNPADPTTYTRPKSGSPLLHVLCGIAIVAMLVGILLPPLGTHCGFAHDLVNSANLRGIDQSMVIFGNSNNDYFPGLSSNGTILTSGVQSAPNSQTGASFHARLWILLNGEYLGGSLLLNPQDSLNKWVTGKSCTSTNTSYAGLQIGEWQGATNTAQNEGRAAEWKNNANSKAVMMSDRLWIAGDTDDAQVQSVWTSVRGIWKGNLVWGDNHAEFAPSNRGFATNYDGAKNTDDNLFVRRSSAMATEDSERPSANAMVIYF